MAFVCEKTIKGFKFAFKPNFSGAPTAINPKGGDRSFDILIEDPALEDELISCGLDVKRWVSKYDENNVKDHLKVKVNFKEDKHDPRNPVIWLVDNDTKKRTLQDEEIVGQIDIFAASNRIVEATAIITVSSYPPTPFKPEGGCTAYLKKMIVFYQPDDIDAMLAEFDGENPFEEDIPF